DCRTVFGEADIVFTTVILKALHDLPEAPWSDLKNKPLNDRGLALRLRQYGIKSKQVRIGEATLKGYERADFIDVWARYLPAPQPSDRSETRETSETSEESQGPNVSVVSDAPSNVSDAASEDPTGNRTKKPNETDFVSDVSLVSLVGDGRGDPGPIPDCLLRRPSGGNGSLPPVPPTPPRRCDHCGGDTGTMNPWNWRGRPDGIWLHPQCEAPWYDAEGGRQ